jgi:hypothetical protein
MFQSKMSFGVSMSENPDLEHLDSITLQTRGIRKALF